jgi:hypothetical protein
VPHAYGALDKIGQVIQTLANLLYEREKEKNKNVSSTFHTIHEMNVPLSNFLKLALPTSKGVDNFEDPYQFLDAT